MVADVAPASSDLHRRGGAELRDGAGQLAEDLARACPWRAAGSPASGRGPLCSAAAPTLNIVPGSSSDLGGRREQPDAGVVAPPAGLVLELVGRERHAGALQDLGDGVLAGRRRGRSGAGHRWWRRRSPAPRRAARSSRDPADLRGRRARPGFRRAAEGPEAVENPCDAHETRSARPAGTLSRLTRSGDRSCVRDPGHRATCRRAAARTPCHPPAQEYHREHIPQGGIRPTRRSPCTHPCTHSNSMTALRSGCPGPWPPRRRCTA